MLTILNDDIIRYISDFLDFKSIIYFKSTNNSLKNILDNIFFKNFAIKEFGMEFWERARARPTNISKPLNSMYEELIRIEKFQKYVEKYNNKRWTKQNFYTFWQVNIHSQLY